MADIAFLLTNRYQIHHYAPIAAALPVASRVVIEVRDQDFGVDETFVRAHLGEVDIRYIDKRELRDLDGTADVIICQTPVLPQVGLAKTLVVAQQYSLAKERYQYGVWRSLADLNLMYGPHSVECVRGFCNAVAVGNPLFDADAAVDANLEAIDDAIVYLPTYGSLSSVRATAGRLAEMDRPVVVKFHHMADRAERDAVPETWTVLDADQSPFSLLSAARAVITDFSGAAFDAALARRPLVLIDGVEETATDAHRLSDSDRNRSALASLSARLDDSISLDDALALATERAGDDEAYRAFVERHYVNLGAAAHACSTAIIDLVEHGPPMRFDADQVRRRNRELMDRNRKLSNDLRRARRANARLRTAPTRRAVAAVERTARRGRVFAAQHPGLERRLLNLKQRLRPPATTVTTPATATATPRPPWLRRQEVHAEIEACTTAMGLGVRTAFVDQRPVLAIRLAERDRFAAAVAAMAPGPEQLVVLARGRRIPLAQLAAHDLALSEQFEICGSDDVKGDGISVAIVTNETDGRIRALDQRVPILDWSEAFASAPGSAARISTMFDGEIDAVYTWVDSSDPAWRQRRAGFDLETTLVSAANPERYINRDELRFSLRSLWAHAPFLRRIHIVTDDQVPAWLDTSDDRINIVDHRDIFPDPTVLPTFNSHAIEACLHRIAGLADHFVYFNDDFFLGREITPDDLFTRAGLPRARFAPTQPVPTTEPGPDAIPTDVAAYRARQIVARDFGMDFTRKHQHIPYALDRRLLVELDERYRAEFDATRRARFRSPSDLAIPSMFAHFAAVASQRAVEWRTRRDDYVYADTGRADLQDRSTKIRSVRPKFFCLNATLHTTIPLDVQARHISDLLAAMFPAVSPFERPATR